MTNNAVEDIQVRYIGDFDVATAGGRSLTPKGKKPKGLLAYLVFNAGKKIQREILIDLLWSDRAIKQGQDSLRQAVYVIKEALGEYSETLIDVDRRSVQFSPNGLVSDLWKQNGSISSKLTGSFLEDLRFVSPVFDDWVVETARDIKSRQIKELERRLAELDPKADSKEILECLEAFLSLDPHNEPIARRAMMIHAEEGQKTHARRAFERLSTNLEADDLEVSAATRDLMDQISKQEVGISDAAPGTTQSDRPKATLHARGIPVVSIVPPDLDNDPSISAVHADFYDQLILRVVQMPEIHLLTPNEREYGKHYVIFVLSGKTQSGLRISMRVEAPDGQVIWSARTDLSPDPDDDQILAAVDKLVMQMLPPLEEHVYFNDPRKEETAYGNFIQAKRIFWTNPESGYIDNAIRHLNQAIEIDPEFLPPYAKLIMYYNTGMFMSRPGTEHRSNRKKAFELSQKLLFLDSKKPNAHIAMGWCLLWQSKFASAERSIRLAMDLQPYEPHRLNVIGTALVYLGHHDEGEHYYDMAQERLHHDFDFQRTDYGEVSFLKQEYEVALSWMENPEIRTPYKTYFFRAAANTMLGRKAEAQSEVEAFVEDIRDRWEGPKPFDAEAGFQWYSDMLPLRSEVDRQTLHKAMQKLGFSIRIPGVS